MKKLIKLFLVSIIVFSLTVSVTTIASAENPKPTFTFGSSPSGNTITIDVVGKNIDHVAVIGSDQTTFIGSMIFDYGVGSFTITKLNPKTEYSFWIKASSVSLSSGQTSSPENCITWQKITTSTVDPKTVYNFPKLSTFCLTIDDGSDENSIKTVLNTLKSNHINGTFFVVGEYLIRYSKLWQQAVNDGNEVCYHTMHHQDLRPLSDDQIQEDLNSWINAAHQVLGVDYIVPTIVRLPSGYGNKDSRILNVFNKAGFTVIAWDSDTDTEVYRKTNNNPTAQNIADYILKAAHPGVISLQHFRTADANGISLYIKDILSKGYAVIKVSQALVLEHKVEAMPPNA